MRSKSEDCLKFDSRWHGFDAKNMSKMKKSKKKNHFLKIEMNVQ
jgi:hypothetical protein